MTPIEVTIGGRKVGMITGAIVLATALVLIQIGELKALALETRNLAKGAASKEEVLAVAMQVKQLATRQDSTSVWVLKHDEWSRGQAGKFTEGIQDLKDRVTYVERRRDKSEALPDSAALYGARQPKGWLHGRSLTEGWNVMEKEARRRRQEPMP